LPRMQSRRCRGTAVQLRRATQMRSSTWAYATPMVTVLPRMQSRQCRGTAVQLRRATQLRSSTWAIATPTVTVLPRMQSRQCRGTAVQLRRATQLRSSTWAYATLMVTVLPRMQSRRCRGTAVQLRRATQMRSSTWACATANGDGVAKDAEQAVSWYRRAAEAGHADAQFNLGVCYVNGDGVAKDAEQAVSWYRRAAEAGHASAQFNLGICYFNGDGVAKDAEQAVSWYRRAAEAGDIKMLSTSWIECSTAEPLLTDHQLMLPKVLLSDGLRTPRVLAGALLGRPRDGAIRRQGCPPFREAFPRMLAARPDHGTLSLPAAARCCCCCCRCARGGGGLVGAPSSPLPPPLPGPNGGGGGGWWAHARAGEPDLPPPRAGCQAPCCGALLPAPGEWTMGGGRPQPGQRRRRGCGGRGGRGGEAERSLGDASSAAPLVGGAGQHARADPRARRRSAHGRPRRGAGPGLRRCSWPSGSSASTSTGRASSRARTPRTASASAAARLEQQALLTQQSLEGRLDAEHQKYLQLLAGVRR